jgi:hypothetical protein
MTEPTPLSQTKARDILARAAEIDAESVSVETLRAAAQEAGISEASFEAALLEHSQTKPAEPALISRRKVMAGAVTAVGIGLLALIAATVVIPSVKEAPAAAPPPQDTPLSRR